MTVFKQIEEVKALLEDIQENQIDSLTKSKYISDGWYSMYVVLLPAVNGGGVVFTVACDEEIWADEYAEYTPNDLQVKYYETYAKALEIYESTDL